MAVFPSFKLTEKGEELLNRSIGEGKTLTFTKFELGDGNPPSDFRKQTGLVNKFYEFPILNTSIQKDQILRIRGYFDNKSFSQDKQLKEIGVFVKIEGNETQYLYSYTNAGDTGDIIPANSRGFYSRTLDVANYIGYATNITFNIEQLRDRYAFNTENEMKVASYLKVGDKVELWGNLVLGDKPTDEYIIQESGEIELSNGLFAKKVSFKYIAKTIEEMQKLALKVGDVIEVLGYYQAGDGAGHKRKIESEDDGSGVLLENGLYANIVHNGEVKVSWFGIRILEKTISSKTFSYEHSGQSGTLQLQVYNFTNTSNSEYVRFLNYANGKTNITFFIDRDIYYTGLSKISNIKNVSIVGNSKIYNTTFQFSNADNLYIGNLNFDNNVIDDIKPPYIVTDNEKEFLTGNKFWYMDLYDIGFSTSGIQIDGDNKSNNITIENCTCRNRDNFIHIASTNFTEKNIKNLVVKKCKTKNIWWHGVALTNAEYSIVSENEFDTHWVGLGVDISTNSTETLVCNNNVIKTSAMCKFQSRPNYITNSNRVVNNTFISDDGTDNFYVGGEYFVYNFGVDNEFYDNKLIINKKTVNIFKINNGFVCKNNHIILNNTVDNVFLLTLNKDISNLLDIDIVGNLVLGVQFKNFITAGNISGNENLLNISNNIIKQKCEYFIKTTSSVGCSINIVNNMVEVLESFCIGKITGTLLLSDNNVICSTFIRHISDSGITNFYISKNKVEIINKSAIGDSSAFVELKGVEYNDVSVLDNYIIGDISSLFYCYNYTSKASNFKNNMNIFKNFVDCKALSDAFIYLAGKNTSSINVDYNYINVKKDTELYIAFIDSYHSGSSNYGMNNSLIGFSKTTKAKVTQPSFTVTTELSALNTPVMQYAMELEGVKQDYLEYSLAKFKYDKQLEEEEKAKYEAYELLLQENPNLTWEEFEQTYGNTSMMNRRKKRSLVERLEEPQIPESVVKFMEKYL